MEKIFHILNGDSLAGQLKETSIDGKIIICREALISGGVQASSLEDFWKLRSGFIAKEYHVDGENYDEKVVSEFQKIINLPENAEVHLWFEDDLFCQTNMWFCLFLLANHENIRIYRVFPRIPAGKDHWKGFSLSDTKDLEESLHSKVEFEEKDIQRGVNLWNAYQNHDMNTLIQLSGIQSDCFNRLKEVIQAYSNTFPENQTLTNPQIYIKELIDSGITDFDSVFEKFHRNFGIYGYGDLQVKKMYDNALKQ